MLYAKVPQFSQPSTKGLSFIVFPKIVEPPSLERVGMDENSMENKLCKFDVYLAHRETDDSI